MPKDNEQPLWMVTNAIGRNAPIEIHTSKNTPANERIMGRFISKMKDTFEIELANRESIKSLEVGASFTAFFVVGEEAFRFSATVTEHVEPPAPPKEDAEKKKKSAKPAPKPPRKVIIERTSGVDTVQRRNAFRTIVTGVEEIRVVLSSEEDDKKFPNGALDTASSLGLGIIFKRHVADKFEFGDRVVAKFEHPSQPRPFEFHTTVVHTIEKTVTFYEGDEEKEEPRTFVGLELVEWPDQNTFGRTLANLDRLLTEIQRERRKTMAA